MKKNIYTAVIIIFASISGWTLTINGLPAKDVKVPEAAAPTPYRSSSGGRSTYTFEMRVPKGSERDAGAKTLKALRDAGMEAVEVETRPGILVLECTGEKLIREWFGSGNTGSLDEYPGQYFNYKEAEMAMNSTITRLQKLGKPVIYSFVGAESARPYFIVYFLSGPGFPKTEKPASTKQVFTEGDSGRIFAAAIGSTIRIELRDNAASTGYKWGFEDLAPEWFKVVSSDYLPPNTDAPGGQGLSIWNIELLKSGKAVIKLALRRPWEGTARPAKTFLIRLDVRPFNTSPEMP